ncbi:unnamed protein product [Closterium sp. NIES-54]
MDAEMASWKSTGTYVDEVPPPGANILDGMWIFRVKRSPGSPPAFKAHYVARDFSQQHGVDYFRTFSPTPKMTTLRVLLHVAAQRDYDLHFLDFSTSFLQGSLHEEIWLRCQPGFTGSFLAGTQWGLRRPVYDLRQALREWHDTLRTTLAALGFAPSTADPLLFLRTDTSLPPFYVLVYVVDLVFATAHTEALTLVKSELQKRHTCADLGELCSYLGLQITQDRARCTITLTQSHMVHQVLQRFGFQFSSPQPTPLSTGHSLSTPPLEESIETSRPYPELVGCLVYLMTCTRPDLAYPLSLLACYVAPGRHRKVHWDAAKRVLRYLCSAWGMGLMLGGQGPVVLTGHADASWADDQATQRSSQGFTFSLGFASVSWRSTRSSSVLSFSCEAEIYAGAMAAQDLRWLTYLLTDLGEQPCSPPSLCVDNKAMIALCQEHRVEHRTKHIALRYFLARELQERGWLRPAYVATGANTADVFTKTLPPSDHQRFYTVLGLVPTLPHLLTFVLLSGLHLPSFSANLVSTAALQDAIVTITTPGGQRVTICTCTRTGRHLATFTRRPGSRLYTLATEPPPIAASAQVSTSDQVAESCSCCLLSHQTLQRHHHLGHPSLPRLRCMHSRLLVSGHPRSLPPQLPSPAPPFLPYVEGRQHAAPHSSFPPTTAPLQTLHKDVWGSARVSGQDHERYLLLVADDYTRYTTVFPLRSKGQSWRSILGVEPKGAEPGGAESEGAESGGAEPRGAASSGGPTGASRLVSPQQLREWFVRHPRLRSGATGAGDAGAGGAGVTTGAGGARGTAATGPPGARTRGTGVAETSGVEGARAGDTTEPGVARAGGIGPGGGGDGGAGAAGAGAVDPGAGGARDTVRPRPYFVPFLQQPASPLPAPSRYTEPSGGLTGRRERESRPESPVRTARRVPCSRPPPVLCLQGVLRCSRLHQHEEIWLRCPPGFTGWFLAGTQWSLWWPVYGLRQEPRKLHDTLRTTLAALGFAPSTTNPSLFLRTDILLPPFYILC